MPTFIDESGDTGHASTSKPYFRLAAVWVPSVKTANEIRDAIRRLRKELGRKSSYEFKFAKTGRFNEGRRRFFLTALEFPFRFAACHIRKVEHWEKASSAAQYWAAATALAASLRATYQESEEAKAPLRDPIWVDRNDDQRFLNAIARAFGGLKPRCPESRPLTAPPRFFLSHKDDMIQLVDMICGAVGTRLDGESTWWNMVRDRCIEVSELP